MTIIVHKWSDIKNKNLSSERVEALQKSASEAVEALRKKDVSMKKDFDRCTLVTAKEDGRTATCRDNLFCSICNHCSKHCLEHFGMSKHLLEMNQNKKAIAVT